VRILGWSNRSTTATVLLSSFLFVCCFVHLRSKGIRSRRLKSPLRYNQSPHRAQKQQMFGSPIDVSLVVQSSDDTMYNDDDDDNDVSSLYVHLLTNFVLLLYSNTQKSFCRRGRLCCSCCRLALAIHETLDYSTVLYNPCRRMV
jgi:hypothetical protein